MSRVRNHRPWLSGRKRYFALFLAGWLSLGLVHPLYSQQKVALVLSGGGAQGLAHIGVLKAFEEYQIPIDLIVGTSAGALVGGLYASGISVDQLETLAKDGTIMELFLGRNELTDSPVWQRSDKAYGNFSIRRSKGRISGPPGLLNDQLIWRDLFLLTAPADYRAHSNFDSLFVPFRAIGANVVKQESVVFDSGSVAEALRISMSLPMVYPAIIKEGAIYMDGGIYNNMPTNIARDLGADYVIAVNVDDVPPSIENLKDVFDFFDFYSGVLFSFSDSSSVSGWDFFINVNTKGFNMFDFAQGEALIERGYEAGTLAAKRLQKTIGRSRDMQRAVTRRYRYQTSLDSAVIQDIQWESLETNTSIAPEFELEMFFPYTSQTITRIINALYATNIYDLIIPKLSGDGQVLTLLVRHKAPMQMIPEINISSVDGFNLLGDWDYRFAENHYSLRSRVGIGNYKGSANITLRPNAFISPYAVHRKHLIWELNVFGNYQVVENRNNDDDVDIFKSGAGISTHFLMSWNQQLVTTASIQESRWTNLSDTLTLDYSRARYPLVSVRYENNHVRQTIPIFDGWQIQAEALSGSWDSNTFYGIRGQAQIGLPLNRKYHVGLDVVYQMVTDPAPIDRTVIAGLPVAFTQSHYLDHLAYSAYTLSFDISRTVFRDDIFLTLRTFNTYLENRLFGQEDGWTKGGDISIQYNSILGPLELGWSVLDDNDYRIVSWTKLYIYF